MTISRASARGSRQPPRRRQHLAVGVSPWTTCSLRVKPRRRRQQFPWVFDLRQVSPRPARRIIREQNNRKSIIPSRPWHPVAVNLSALVALRRPSWPFVDHSFPFAFFRLFQTSPAPALPCRSYENETIRNRPIPLRPWCPVTVHLNALVALRGPSCVFVDHSFPFVFFRLFQTSRLAGRSSETRP